MGPVMDMTIRRHRPANAGTEKEAFKATTVVKKKVMLIFISFVAEDIIFIPTWISHVWLAGKSRKESQG